MNVITKVSNQGQMLAFLVDTFGRYQQRCLQKKLTLLHYDDGLELDTPGNIPVETTSPDMEG